MLLWRTLIERGSNAMEANTGGNEDHFVFLGITSFGTYQPRLWLRRYFQHVHFIPMVGVGKRGTYQLVHGNLPRQHPSETTLRFTGPEPANSRQ